jgi:branched-subunit amino acid transport protein AzlD
MTIGNLREIVPGDGQTASVEAAATAALPRSRFFMRRVRLPAAYAVLGAVALSPLFWAAVPPLVDYPNHLARMAVLANVGPSALHANYVADWRFLPNLAMDLFVPSLARLMPLEVAGRLFIAATLILLVAGTAALHRALHGKVGIWPLCSLLFVYNFVFWYGFLNYLFGLGAALLGFAAWIATANWRPFTRIVVFAGIASAIFVLHLFAFGVYGLLVGSYEFGAILRRRSGAADALARLAVGIVQFAPAAGLWVLCIGNGGPQYVSYGTLAEKLAAIVAPFLFGIPPTPFDALLLGITISFCYLAWRRRLVALAPAMRLPLIATLITAAVMPAWMSGSWGADLRLPVALPFIILASTRPRQWARPAAVVWSTVALALLFVRVWSVSQAWSDGDQNFKEFRAALSVVPVGAKMFAVQSPMPAKAEHLPGIPAAIQKRSPKAFSHLVALAVIDRGAFIPSLFFDWYPIKPTDRNAGLARIMGGLLSPWELTVLSHASVAEAGRFPRNVLGEPPCCINWPSQYDFVVWIDFGHPPHPLPEHLRNWSGGSFFHIYRVVPGSGAGGPPDHAPD